MNYCVGQGGCGKWKKIISAALCKDCYDNWVARRSH